LKQQPGQPRSTEIAAFHPEAPDAQERHAAPRRSSLRGRADLNVDVDVGVDVGVDLVVDGDGDGDVNARRQ